MKFLDVCKIVWLVITILWDSVILFVLFAIGIFGGEVNVDIHWETAVNLW